MAKRAPKGEGPGMGWRKGKDGKITDKPNRALDVQDRILILKMSKAGKSVTDIADALGRSSSTISRFLARTVDTRELAMEVIRSGAVTLAERIIKKANVDQSIEVLSRPGISVLEPPVKSGGQSTSLQVSVAVNSCGTVVSVSGGQNGSELPSMPGRDVHNPQGILEAVSVGAGASEGAREGVPATPR